MSAHNLKKRVKYNYLVTKVVIHRCAKCAEAQTKVNKIVETCVPIGLIAYGISLILIAFLQSCYPIIGILGSMVFLFASDKATEAYLRSLGTVNDRNMKTHPEVARFLRLGYEIEESPTQQGF